MQTRLLGETGLELSVIGLGTWVFGGRWGGAEDADSRAACHAALDAGVNWIDTADVYGQGRAERIIGGVLAERGEDVLISTKGGVAWETEPEFRIWREASPDYLRRAVDASLQRLGVETIDVYHVHWPVASVPVAETIGALNELRRAGKIRAVAVSNYEIGDLERAGEAGRVDAYQPGYHLLRREIEHAELPWCAEHGVGVLAYGPLAHGLFTGKMDERTSFPSSDWRAQSDFFSDGAFAERVEVARGLAGIAEQSGRPGGPAELAVAWVLRRPDITSAIVGARDADQARANAALAGRPLADDEAAAIDALIAAHPDASRSYGHGEPPDPGAR
jgi:aryl-alcohol dehydrogenase-like predicted oxidoreductase